MLSEAVAGLHIQPDGLYVDGTFGRGGHAAKILQQLSPQGQLLLMDRDRDAVAQAQQRFADDNRVTIVHRPYSALAEVLDEATGREKVDGLLLDLGVSSPQLDQAERGFSFMQQGPLDMRMDQRDPLTAANWLQSEAEDEIARILWEFGDERHSRKIARMIVAQRQQQPITQTEQLAELVKRALPGYHKRHPATRTFQAIRIHINRELEELRGLLDQAVSRLPPGGRIVIISFHSLEDRMVKRFFRRCERGEQELPPDLPIRNVEQQGVMRTIGKPQRATADEIALNPRSRSAVLRVAERLDIPEDGAFR